MMKHTPGPWEAERACDMAGFDRSEWWISSARGSVDIATTSGEKAPEEEEANAYLIAIAPEMYRELQAICDNCHGDREAGDCEDCNTGKVLAKAEGREIKCE